MIVERIFQVASTGGEPIFHESIHPLAAARNCSLNATISATCMGGRSSAAHAVVQSTLISAQQSRSVF